MNTLLNEENLRVEFPVHLNHQALESLCRYHILQYEGKRVVQLHSKRVDEFGDMHSQTAPQTIEQIRSHSFNNEVSGSIRSAVVTMASFRVKSKYDEETGNLYSGIEFDVTPGYEVGELQSDDVETMREFGKSAYSFFEKLKASQ